MCAPASDELISTAGSASVRATPSTSALAMPTATTPGRQSLASTKSANTSDGWPPRSATRSASVAPEPWLVLGADHLDEAHDLGAAVREHRLLGAVPLVAGGGAPRRIVQQRRLVVAAGGDDAVPTLGHRHEHHRRVPVEAEVDGARRELRVEADALRARARVARSSQRCVRPGCVGVGEARPRERDAARRRSAGELVDARSRGRRRAGRARTRRGRGRASEHVEQRLELGAVGTRATAPGDRAGRRRGTTSTGPTHPRRIASSRMRAIAAHSRRRRGARPRVVAHHREAEWAVADERGDVDAGAASR